MHAKVIVWNSSFRKQSFSILIWIVVWCLSWPTSSWDIVLRFRQWDYFLALGDCEFKPVISGGGKPEPLIITWEHAETRNNVRGHHIIEWKSCQVNLIRANSPDRFHFRISRRNKKWRTLFRHSIGKRKKRATNWNTIGDALLDTPKSGDTTRDTPSDTLWRHLVVHTCDDDTISRYFPKREKHFILYF